MIDRATLLQLTSVELEDQRYLLSEIAKLRAAPAPSTTTKTKQRRPKNIATLRQELDALQQMNAWLHSEWNRLRGIEAFEPESAFDRLAKLGIVAAPAAPMPKGPGRPRYKGKELELAFWADLIIASHQARGQSVTKAAALRQANVIVRSRHGLVDTNWQPEIKALRNAYSGGKKALSNFGK